MQQIDFIMELMVPNGRESLTPVGFMGAKVGIADGRHKFYCVSNKFTMFRDLPARAVKVYNFSPKMASLML